MSGQVILVTGANQGLGYCIIEVAAQRDPESIFILCSRNRASGEEAKRKLQAEHGIKAAIDVQELDVTDDGQIEALVKHVSSEYGRLDVLVNNAGHLFRPTDDSLSALRKCYDATCSLNLTSVAVVTEAFMPLLYRSAASPKVLNITSGLGSIENTLTKKMARFPAYGGAKIGMNGLSMHQQTMENDRIKAEEAGELPGSGKAYIRWYIITPGALKTAFTNFSDRGRDPREGAEPAVRIMLDRKDEYRHQVNWEWQGGEMKIVPW